MKLIFMLIVLVSGLLIGATVSPTEHRASGSFVAHEWGTFTSVQGGDGVQMMWEPQDTLRLPSFVHDRVKLRPFDAPFISKFKSAYSTKQRMETPVIYFYSDEPVQADVAVHFPEGTITEWYPGKGAADLTQRIIPNGKPALHWRNVHILAATESTVVPAMASDSQGSHYFAARETDASLISMKEGQDWVTEKFLFYRGVGNFTAPLTVTMDADCAHVTLHNAGAEPIRHLYLCNFLAGASPWIAIENLLPGESRKLPLPGTETARTQTIPALAAAMREALTREGLYAKESEAMVKTWEDSWFSERGIRVLYTLPRAWTDRILPLAISPAPAGIERVMVGRAEVISPAIEKLISERGREYATADAVRKLVIVKEIIDLNLGRFCSAAFHRAKIDKSYTDEEWKGISTLQSDVSARIAAVKLAANP